VLKTARWRGLVVLPADTVAVLRDQRRHQLEERLAAGGDYVDRGLVFCDLHGRLSVRRRSADGSSGSGGRPTSPR
jgi:hypothetical protein